jgi:DNA-binding MarR family transcriptional regulator
MPMPKSPSPRVLDPNTLPDILQFMQVLWMLVHRLEQTSKRMTGEIGVTGPQRLTLRVIGLYPGLSAGELARVLHLHPSTLTGILHRLVVQRLVARVEAPTDRRRAVLRLTPLGARLNAVQRGTVEHAVGEALAKVNPRDRAATQRVLAHLASQLAGVDSRPRASARTASGTRSRGRQP